MAHRDYLALHCRNPLILFSLVWTFGLLSGSASALCSDDSLSSTMLAALDCSLSISGLLGALFLPLLLTAFAVFISQPFLVLPAIFLKAFLFSFVGTGVLCAYQASGWLARGFLMFSDILTLPVLWWIWMQSASESGTVFFHRLIPAAFLFALIGCFDYAFVAPLWARLI